MSRRTAPVEYAWEGRRFPVDATLVGQTVDRLSETLGGVCPPGALVDEARPADSPLHPLFTWSDDVAAEKWRTHEARHVIGSIVVLSTAPAAEPRPPAFVHVIRPSDLTDEPVEGYRPMRLVVRSSSESEFAMEEALRMLDGLARRFSHVPELAPVWSALLAVRGLDQDTAAAS